MRKLTNRVRRAWRSWRWSREPIYVLIYDKRDADGINVTEEYYGYFSSPAEARELWGVLSAGDPDGFENVMLCRVIETWRQPNERTA